MWTQRHEGGRLEKTPDCLRSGNTGFGNCVWSRASIVGRHPRHLYCRRGRPPGWRYVAWCKRSTRLDRSRTPGSSTFRGVQFSGARANPRVVVRAVVLGNRGNIGLFVVKAVHARALDGVAVVIALTALLACSLWCCISYFPKLLADRLNHFTRESAPSFALQPVSGGSAPTAWKPGKILVMDFFATWCVPCKAELPELQAAYSDLNDKSDIQFVLIGSDVGGDTPERVRTFAKKQSITVPLAFDPGCKVLGKFDPLGLA